MPLRITTWNVNGIRNPFSYQPWREKRTFQDMFDILEADIVVMQETKIQRKDLQDDMVLVPGWDVYFSLPKHKKGYSGVAIYTRNSKCCPIRAEEGVTGVLCPPNSTTKFRDLPQDQQIGGYPQEGQLFEEIDEATLDSEGRCVILEFPAFVLIGTYSPANRDSSRDDFRVSFFNALDVRVRNLIAAGKQVILTGDLNVIRSELDTKNVMESLRKEGMTIQDWMSTPSRHILNQLVFNGYVVGERDGGREESLLWDLCRCFHPDRQGMFTCWDTKKNTRPANNGSRIDYILCSDGIKKWFIDSNIQEGLHGSDHCPVYGTLGDMVKKEAKDVHLQDLMNPSDMFRDGKRLREWSQKDLLPTSAKLIPEFDRRQSIRDMFMKKPTTKAPTPKPTEPAHDSFESLSKSSSENKEAMPPEENSQSQPSTASQASDTFLSPYDDPSCIVVSLEPPPIKSGKRPAERPSRQKRPFKRTKTNESDSATKANGGFAQSTLKGFLKSKQATAATTLRAAVSNEDDDDDDDIFQSQMKDAIARSLSESQSSSQTPASASASRALEPSAQPALSPSSTPASASAIDEAEKVFDPIHAKESWSKLQLGKRVPPRCEHGEPCISLVTKKAGVNCGRSFYICPRPLGPSGDKEKGTQWRCATFIWSSDWKER